MQKCKEFSLNGLKVFTSRICKKGGEIMGCIWDWKPPLKPPPRKTNMTIEKIAEKINELENRIKQLETKIPSIQDRLSDPHHIGSVFPWK